MRTDRFAPVDAGRRDGTSGEVVSMIVGEQRVAIPVQRVQDVLGPQRLTSVPLGPAEIAGVLNLRGRIVTAIDLRRRLGMAPAIREKSMSVVVEHDGELYSLIIDQVGEVLEPPLDRFETDLVPLTPAWRDLARGVYRLEDHLLVLLDVAKILGFAGQTSTSAREERAA